MRLKLATLACVAASMAAAQAPPLRQPVDCVLGETCFIQQYVDRDPGPDTEDFACGDLTYDGHKGTDFALTDLSAMSRGVDVLAAAPGRVLAIRNDAADSSEPTQISGQECGNGVLLQHPNGWETQYCHLARGSISVTPGDAVDAGTALGQIGLSGLTEFPHVHFSLRHNNRVVDPFRTSDGCGSQTALWTDPIAYIPAGLINLGFSEHIPEFEAILAGTASKTELTTNAPALVLWAHFFGPRTGDILAVEITGPDGPFLTERITIERDQARAFQAIGRRTPQAGWPPGTYTARVSYLRNGAPLAALSTKVALSPPP